MILVDGKAQLYRLLGGMRPYGRSERAAAGPPAPPPEPEPADASVVGSLVEGFLYLIRNLLRLEPATTHLVIAFDAAGLTFRHEQFPAYKAGRPPAAPEMEPAIQALQEVLPRMGVGVLRVPGVEAEDVLASVAARATDAAGGFTDVVIMSPDKDLYQLLGPHVRLLRGLKAPTFPPGAPAPTPEERTAALQAAAAWYTADDFREEHPGLEPPQWVEVMALAGSASDNVPGVPGVGVKIAHQLMAVWGSLEALLPHASEVKRKKVAEVLATPEGAQAARFTRSLVTIATDLSHPPVIQPLDNFQLRPVPQHDQEAALQLASSLGVQPGVLNDIISYPPRSSAPPAAAAPSAMTGFSSFSMPAPVHAAPGSLAAQQPLHPPPAPAAPFPQPSTSQWQPHLVPSAAAAPRPMHTPFIPTPPLSNSRPLAPAQHPQSIRAPSPVGSSQWQPQPQPRLQPRHQAPPQQHTPAPHTPSSAPPASTQFTQQHTPAPHTPSSAPPTSTQFTQQQQELLRQQFAASSWKPLGYSPSTPTSTPTTPATSTPAPPSTTQPPTSHPAPTPAPPPPRPSQHHQQPIPTASPASSPYPQGRPPMQPSLRPFQPPPFTQPPRNTQQPPFGSPPRQPLGPSIRRATTSAPRSPAGPPPPRTHPMAAPTSAPLGAPARSYRRQPPRAPPRNASRLAPTSTHTGGGPPHQAAPGTTGAWAPLPQQGLPQHPLPSAPLPQGND